MSAWCGVGYFFWQKGGGMKMYDEILLREEAAKMLKLPERTVDYYVSTGQIPFSRLGPRHVRFSRSRLMEWMAEREGVTYRHGK